MPKLPHKKKLLHQHNVSLISLKYFEPVRYGLASDCCLGNRPNPANPQCIPIPVPADDPYLRRAGVRCLNLTRVDQYQDYGCLPQTLPYERVSRTKPRKYRGGIVVKRKRPKPSSGFVGWTDK